MRAVFQWSLGRRTLELGKRTLIRYEMATIIERILVRIYEIDAATTNKSDLDQKAEIETAETIKKSGAKALQNVA